VILVFGTVCIDRLRRVPNLPAPGGYVEVEEELTLLGGEAANTANALTRWADDVLLAGNPIGISVDAVRIHELLDERGLTLQELLAPGELPGNVATPVCDIYVTADGERTMFGRGFSTLENHISLDATPWRPGGWFTAEPNMEHAARTAAIEAYSQGMKPYLMDFVQREDPIFEGSFWQSSTDWAGHRNNMQRNVAWVKELVARKGCFAILSDGPNGFVAGSPELNVRAYPPFPAPLVVDTTGAGDVFRAGMLHGLDAGWAIPDCLRFASAAGCLKCRALGATTDVPTIQEIETHIADNPDVSRQYG